MCIRDSDVSEAAVAAPLDSVALPVPAPAPGDTVAAEEDQQKKPEQEKKRNWDF
jgi:hypothetical protein